MNENITAINHQPEVEAFLLNNSNLNNDKKIPFYMLNWESETLEKIGKFDLIIGSNVIYQQNHREILAHFINHYAQYKCEVIIVDLSRGNYSKFKKEMINFGFKYEK